MKVVVTKYPHADLSELQFSHELPVFADSRQLSPPPNTHWLIDRPTVLTEHTMCCKFFGDCSILSDSWLSCCLQNLLVFRLAVEPENAMEVHFEVLWKAVSSRVEELRKKESGFKKVPGSEYTQQIHDAYLLPHAAIAKHGSYWEEELVDEVGSDEITEERIPILFAMAYYGPGQQAPSAETWKKLVTFVDEWVKKHKVQPDERQLWDVVFCYALGLGRQLRDSSDRSEANADIWDNRWPVAHWAFDFFVVNSSTSLRYTLENSGVLNTEVAEEGNAEHLLEILLEDVPCPCVESYCGRRPKAQKEVVQNRHQREHRMEAWFDRSGWPVNEKNPSKQRSYWYLYLFVFRALFGERPVPRFIDVRQPPRRNGNGSSRGRQSEANDETKIQIKLKSLDKGLLFELLYPRPEVFTTLVCDEDHAHPGARSGKCKRVIQDFGYCDQCKTTNPRFEREPDRLRSRDDDSWRPTKARKCSHCKTYYEYEETERFCPKCRDNETAQEESQSKKPGNPFPVWIFKPLAMRPIQDKPRDPDEDYYRETVELLGDMFTDVFDGDGDAVQFEDKHDDFAEEGDEF